MNLKDIFPKVCTICHLQAGRREIPVCSSCLSMLQTALTDKCRRCKRAPSECVCTDNKDVRFGFFYSSYGLRELIFRAKRRLDNDTADLLIELTAEVSGINMHSFDGVAYVPRSIKNKRRFGQDQARRLACSISRLYGIPVIDALKRIGGSEQKLLSRGERLKNIKNKYVIKENFNKDKEYKKILLVDDVSTTGATLKLCAELLRKGGISRAVVPFVIAKTESPKK